MQPCSLRASGETAGTAPAARTAQVPLELAEPKDSDGCSGSIQLGRLVLEADRGCAGEAGGAVSHGDLAGAPVEWQIRVLPYLPRETTKCDPQCGY